MLHLHRVGWPRGAAAPRGHTQAAELDAARSAYAAARAPEIETERDKKLGALVAGVRAALDPFRADAQALVDLEDELTALDAPGKHPNADLHGIAGAILSACNAAVVGAAISKGIRNSTMRSGWG